MSDLPPTHGPRPALPQDIWRSLVCAHCGPDRRWTPEQTLAQLAHFPGWSATNQTVEGLHKTFEFTDFNAMEPVLIRLLAIARLQDHHPDVQFGYRTLTVHWSTHSAGGISDNDWICAALLEEALSTVSA